MCCWLKILDYPGKNKNFPGTFHHTQNNTKHPTPHHRKKNKHHQRNFFKMHFQLYTFLLLSFSSVAFSDATPATIDVLIAASAEGDSATVQTYLAAYRSTSDINAKNKFGQTALTSAADKGHLDIIQLLLDSDANVNARAKYGVTALMKAASKGHLEIAELLIAKKADVNAQAKGRITALMEAATMGHLDIVELLLVSNADPKAKDKHGETAKKAAFWKGHDDVADLLQSAEHQQRYNPTLNKEL